MSIFTLSATLRRPGAEVVAAGMLFINAFASVSTVTVFNVPLTLITILSVPLTDVADVRPFTMSANSFV